MAKAGPAQLRKIEEGQYVLEGVLSLGRLRALLPQPVAAVAGNATIDLVGLVDSDSATAALMVSWSRRAAKKGESIHYKNCSKKLNALLDLYDLPPVLGIL